MRPFLSYYGGKWRAAALYPRPRYRTIIEPFAGGAGYSLCYPYHDVILVEKNHKVAEVWRYLVEANRKDILSLPILKHGDNLDSFDLSDGERWFIGFSLNNGVSSPCKQLSAWSKERNGCAQFWGEERRLVIANQVDRISHWEIIEGDYSSLPTSIAATWFVDPPYSGPAGRMYPENNIDYVRLSSWCREISGQKIVCEQEGATWLPFRPLAEINSNPSKNGKKYSKESIWTD